MDPCVYVIYTETVPELNFYRNSDPDPFEIKLLDFSVKSYPKNTNSGLGHFFPCDRKLAKTNFSNKGKYRWYGTKY